jgi:hypothetical protein
VVNNLAAHLQASPCNLGAGVVEEGEAMQEMRGVVHQRQLGQQAHLKHLTASQSRQEAQHQLQLVLQEVKSLYHGTHNDISTRYLLRW